MKQMKKALIALLLGILMLQNFSVTSYAAESDEKNGVPSGITYDDIPAAIETYVEEHKETTVGMSVAVYDGNGVIYQNGFGYADKENNIMVDDQTVYDWGSTSKLFIWISVMQLVEQGKLDLKEDIRNYLPDGFLKNLTYDKEITMLDLMNHQAGFQETYFVQTANAEEMVSLEEALSRNQPKQIFKPGEVTAYSNWGAALAAYIVQNISGTDYVDYVHKNIFDPLGMKHASIDPIYRDNVWVKQQRERLACYNGQGERIPGKGLIYIYLYPAGSAVGTISDLTTFAQAVTPSEGKTCPLFEKQETLELLYTATSFYGSSGVPNNYHGFFAGQYGVETLGHGGNTFGCSAMLQFDPVTGIGMVVMANQAHETVYNYDMYELIFGKFSDSELAKIERTIPKGFLISTRTIKEGPFALMSAMGFSVISEDDLSSWWYQDGNRVYLGYSDMVVSTKDAIKGLMSCLLFIIAGIYGALTLIGGGLVYSPIQRRLHRKKGVEIIHSFRKWNYCVCGIMALILVDYALILFRMNIGNITGDFGHIESYMVQSGIIGALSVFLIVCLVCGAVVWRKKQITDTRKEKAKYIVTMVMALLMLAVVVVFDMYQFWAF